MKTLPAGTKKYLLLDAARIERNEERTKRGEPIVIVVEVDGDTTQLHRAHSLTIREGTVALDYSQNRKTRLVHGLEVHAAFVTFGEVVLDADETAAAPALPGRIKRPLKTTPTNENQE